MGEELSGSQILERAEAAYDTLSSYEGASAVIAVYNRSGLVRASTASAQIQFLRARGLRIEGRTAGGGRFTLISDLERMWRSYQGVDGGAWKESPELGLGGVTGVSQGAATTIPALLIRSRWGYPFNARDSARLEGREQIGDANCLKVMSETDSRTCTFWVDSASFLLRQMREEADEAQTISTRAHARELLRERGEESDADKTSDITSTMSLHVFAIGSVNQPLDASLFGKPEPH